VKEEALRLSAFAYGQAVYRDYADFLIQTDSQADALQLLDRSRSRTLEEGLDFAGKNTLALDKTAGDPHKVARNLQASILFYSLGPEQSHLWAVTASQTQVFTLPGQKQIQALIEKHQKDIQQALDPAQMANSAAAALYDTLIGPAAAMILQARRYLSSATACCTRSISKRWLPRAERAQILDRGCRGDHGQLDPHALLFESRAAPDCERAFVDRRSTGSPRRLCPAPRCGHGNQAGTSALSA